MIVDFGNRIHDHKSKQPDQSLLGKIIHVVSNGRLRFIRAGTVQHNQAKAHQKNHCDQQLKIKILRFLRRSVSQPVDHRAHSGPGRLSSARRLCRRRIGRPHHLASLLHHPPVSAASCRFSPAGRHGTAFSLSMRALCRIHRPHTASRHVFRRIYHGHRLGIFQLPVSSTCIFILSTPLYRPYSSASHISSPILHSSPDESVCRAQRNGHTIQGKYKLSRSCGCYLSFHYGFFRFYGHPAS